MDLAISQTSELRARVTKVAFMREPDAVAGGNALSFGDVEGGNVRVEPAALGVLGEVVVSLYAGQLAVDTDEELMK
jgi:hypothetical protein